MNIYKKRLKAVYVVTFGACLWFGLAFQAVSEQSLSFKLGLVSEISSDRKVFAFYEDRDFTPIWIDSSTESKDRRVAFLQALDSVGIHALPEGKYGKDALLQRIRTVKTDHDLGVLEALFTRSFLDYANDVHSGLLKPSEVMEEIARTSTYLSVQDYLSGVASEDGANYIVTLPPQSQEYQNLLSVRQELLDVAENGGWGKPVPQGKFSVGDSGPEIVALRNRLIAQKYLDRSVSSVFDEKMLQAVKEFQTNHGLLADGIVGPGTIEELNVNVFERLKSVTVALERERWMSLRNVTEDFKKSRTIVVNLTDFTAKILDDGVVTFETRSVIGTDKDDQRSPEFSDVMEHMVINPSWYVPRSITVKEYLPNLQQDPESHSYLTMFVPDTGDVVPRHAVDFTQFDEDTFPFELKQMPSPSNALGRVKFMLPNRHNIYLHDTPHKTLFLKE
ncbi:MAG: peptidoglycan-binding protein [Paracoccaceae bacterium]